MRAVVIHAAKDLRIDNVPPEELRSGAVRIKLERGGICGSDLHYYQDGRIGTITLKMPMVLGHEVAGLVDELGPNVAGLNVGDRVAINPSRPCGICRFCSQGQQIHCLSMRFYGSAMPYPHIHGAFQESVVADATQCFVVPKTTSAAEAAVCEPLAVCLHAVRRAGSVFGKRVLVTGAGPIGALTVLAARQAGAAEIVATDVTDTPFELVTKLGANRCVNAARDAEKLAAYGKDKGSFDVLFECSGNERALTGAFDVLRPGAVIVQVGLGGSFTLPINVVVAKEFELRGTFRFHEEFGLAAAMIGQRRVDVTPIISATMPFTDARAAFDLAGDRSRAMKVQLAFS